jgi:hypothetical protein
LWHGDVMIFLLSYPTSLIPSHMKRTLLWRFESAGHNKTSLGLQTRSPTFLPDINQIFIFLIHFYKVHSLRFRGKP